MNKHIKDLYVLIYENQLLAVATNLNDFYQKLLEQDIGFQYSKSTLRNRFLDKSRFNHPSTTGRIYWLEKIPNSDYS